MSASSKKKLRNEQEAAKLTERQIAEQKEAKKLKLYTAAFVAVLALLLVIAVVVGVNQTITNTGIREKNTVAMTVGQHEISNAELNYYYIDSINTFYSQNGSYAAMFGLDVTLPLNEQYMSDTETWADYFLSSAKDTVANVYAMNDAAIAAGHTLTEEEAANVDAAVSSAALYASIYGYGDADTYLKAMYGKGANEESYRSYVEKSVMADSYYNAYGESLTYTDADLRAAEAENYAAYSSFTYNQYYVAASRFLEGGTTAEDGTTTYSDEEKAASIAAAEEAAKSLIGEEITSVEALDEAIAALSINAESTTAESTHYADFPYSSITAAVAPWVSDDARQEGDKTYVENTSTDENGNKVINGYYVVYYTGSIDNTFALKNARHILVSFEGGTADEYGNTTYTDEEKAAAKATAEEILKEWESGEATEASFAGLAAEKSTDTGSTANGGLYEDIYPGQMVTAFEDWCYDSSRKTGDTGIVETEYGYHIMYFVGDSQLNYRDYQITNALKSQDLSAWYESVVTAQTVTDGDTQYISMDLVLSAG